MQLIAFYILSTVVLISAISVIASRNPVHSVLWLILSFFTAAGLLVLIGAEFLAMLLIVVYVGAVAVLFLFVVMMLDVDFAEMRKGFADYFVVGGLVALALLAEIGVVAASANSVEGRNFDPSPGADTNAEALSNVLYTDYLLLFQMAGIVLLVAMIGAIVLTLRHRPDVKRQKVEEQTARRREEAVELIKVNPGQGINVHPEQD
ncbi:NADH-quinone oxidoreductase subunit J [Hirschia baltica]|uniref:NADH-quinone oxidoreductase subunit J n=1 Tax=Hirschia baltica (strain ATCC 49814 / DSM 5838 / IFAM 1418) TaxID=582402 RepID=C6XJX4_HIRBI|nr:NADH-quinone oxidoreductase subunit J [Hirschia baltica]ACT59419.1 NADH-ubiquinone/plastoquinone oxidoreductase chain 6 [Hirschia baltica ATCC 49814]